MRYATVFAVVLCLLTTAHAVEDKSATGDFFNGKDLTGWEGLAADWSVKDGALVGTTPADQKFNTFLCSKKKYRDFELTFQIRLKDGKGNSGVQIRSELVENEHYTVKGPQADIGQEYWGSLYGELFGGMMKKSPWDEVSKVLKPDDFNDYSVRCVGKHCTIKINGVTTVDDDFEKMPEEGIIAWQLHGNMGEMEATFRNIQFKDLSAGK